MTFVNDGLRLEPTIELPIVEGYWSRTGQLLVTLRNEAPPYPQIIMRFNVAPGIVPGGAGRFEAKIESIDHRGCKATGTLSAPAIPRQLTRERVPFSAMLDLEISDCAADVVLATIPHLRGTIRMQLAEAFPPDL